MNVRNWKVPQELADSGAEWWFDMKRQSLNAEIRQDSLADEQEARRRKTKRLELPTSGLRGELRVEAVGSLRLYVEEVAVEDCMLGHCVVQLIYSAFYIPPDYRARRQMFEFSAYSDRTVLTPGRSVRENFPELELVEAVEESFFDERADAAPAD